LGSLFATGEFAGDADCVGEASLPALSFNWPLILSNFDAPAFPG
jgi:hypothetical protein